MKNWISILFLALSLTAVSQSVCDQLQITSVNLNALDPSFLRVAVQNESTEIFSYPGFRVYDTEGNLIGEELVNFFGIGEESVHAVPHEMTGIVPGETMDLVLELWTGFYDTLWCTFEVTAELKPDTECAAISLNVNAIPEVFGADYLQLDIVDEEGESFESLNFYIDPDTSYFWTEVCLPIGCYEVQLVTLDAVISNDLAVIFVQDFGGSSVTENVAVGAAAAFFDLEVYEGCSIETAVAEEDQPTFAMYPNPTSGLVYFNTTISGKLINTLGEACVHFENEKSLDLNSLPTGLYFVVSNLGSYRVVVE